MLNPTQRMIAMNWKPKQSYDVHIPRQQQQQHTTAAATSSHGNVAVFVTV